MVVQLQGSQHCLITQTMEGYKALASEGILQLRVASCALPFLPLALGLLCFSGKSIRHKQALQGQFRVYKTRHHVSA